MYNQIILTIPSLPDDIILKYNDSNNIWTSENPKLSLTKEDDSNNVKILDKSEEIKDKDLSFIANLFLEKWLTMQGEHLYQEINGLEDNDSNAVVRPDFDPEQIRIDPKTYSIYDIKRFIDSGDLDIEPDFQRHFVWEKKRQSRLIESLMLRIPLPVFYLSQDKEGEFQVVDGLQRLTTIYRFINKELVLKELEYLHDCQGKTFETLEPKYRRRIEQAQLIFFVIDPSTSANVKFELFKRINQGGKALNAQEIRNSMSKKETRSLLNKLSASDFFLKATDNSIKNLRMEDQELTLRFIAFYLLKFRSDFVTSLKVKRKEKVIDFGYTGYMETFLDEVLDILNDKQMQGEHEHKMIGQAFANGMQNAYYLFGKYTFRKCKKKDLAIDAKRQLINKSLFTVWSVLLSQYDYKVIKEKNEEGCLIQHLAERIDTDNEYYDSLTTGTNQVNKIEFGFKVAENLILNHVKI
jgi:uncharacterized protein with ParB-like and HNH nuclease domain